MPTKLTLDVQSTVENTSLAAVGSFTLNRLADRALSQTVAEKSREIAQNYYDGLMAGIVEAFKNGFDGASAGATHVDVLGPGKDMSLTLRPAWEPLSPEYLVRKRKSAGNDTFHVFRKELQDHTSRLRSKKVRETLKVSERSPGKGRKAEIRFQVGLDFGTLKYPLDDLVRRPLVNGAFAPTTFSARPSLKTRDPGLPLIRVLETGAVREGKGGVPNVLPPRPFLRNYAIRVHALMRKAIVNQPRLK